MTLTTAPPELHVPTDPAWFLLLVAAWVGLALGVALCSNLTSLARVRRRGVRR